MAVQGPPCSFTISWRRGSRLAHKTPDFPQHNFDLSRRVLNAGGEPHVRNGVRCYGGDDAVLQQALHCRSRRKTFNIEGDDAAERLFDRGV